MLSRLAIMLALAASFLLTSCAGLLGPREVEVPLYKLQEALNRRMPVNNRYLDLFDISVSNPRLSLQADTNRLVTSMDAMVAPPFMKKAWNGSLTLSGVLQVDPDRHALVLADPRLDNFAFDGADPLYSRQIAKIGSVLAQQILKDVPLYTFKPEDFRYGGMRFIPARINAKADSIVVSFEPAR